MWLPWLPYSWVLMAALALAVTVQAAPPDRLSNPSKAGRNAPGPARRNESGTPIHLKRLKRRIAHWSENLKDNGLVWDLDIKSDIQYMLFHVNSYNVERSTMQKACIDVGGFLPEPKSQAENDALGRMARSDEISPMLGMRMSRSGVWKWSRDGSQVKWFNWKIQRADIERMHCALMVTGKWDDTSCAKRFRGFLCEKASTKNPVPEWKLVPRFDLGQGKRYIDMKQTGDPKGGNQQACLDIDAYLPQPINKKDNDFLKKMTPKDFRLGISYIKGVWRFIYGGDKVTWFDWIKNTRIGGDNICVYIGQISGVRGWIDHPCESRNGLTTVVCEHERDEGIPRNNGPRGPYEPDYKDGKQGGARWITDYKTGIQYKRFWATRDNVGIGRAAMQNACLNNRGFLPEPKSKAENDALRRMASDYGVDPMLGLRLDKARVWKWARDGSQSGWTNWHKVKGIRDNCVQMVRGGIWDDISCSKRFTQFICEKATTKTPAPEWKRYSDFGHEIRYIDLKKTGKPQVAKQSACLDIDAFLPQPMDKQENDFLKKITPKDFRLGIVYIKGAWRFPRGGKNVTWFDWINKARAGGDNKCVYMGQISGVRGWIDQVCDSKNGLETVVCEKGPPDHHHGPRGPNDYPGVMPPGMVGPRGPNDYPGVMPPGMVGPRGINYAASRADGKLQPPAMLISAAIGLCQLIHFM